ncbi:MAG: competence/damage-inducible protein A [Verrucomicrobiales bacterium]|nr:competence/damage-inducible protein A [Verrucomicrobiales bacterium]
MKIEIINTGSELLLGLVINTHLAFIGDSLFKLGLRVQRQVSIPDGEEIRHALAEAMTRADVIIVTGGLGPTTDDITCDITAELLGRELKTDTAVLKHIENIFSARGLELTAPNLSQALIPEGGEALHNPKGTAPGIYLPAIEDHSPHIFLLPGPPRELIPMFKNEVAPRLVKLRDQQDSAQAGAQTYTNFKTIGIGESNLAHALDEEFATLPDLEIGYCCRLGEVDVRLIGSPKDVEQGSSIIRKKYQREIVTESEDPLEQIIVDLLTEKKQIISTAESCTGGLIASTLTDVSGSSAIFQRAYITYANDAKAHMLGIPAQLIEDHGAVSDETVRAMAEGCLQKSDAHFALAVSGIAGPTGGSEEKPVGTVYIALAEKNQPTFSNRFYFPLDRSSFKIRTTRAALDLLRQRLQGFELI